MPSILQSVGETLTSKEGYSNLVLVCDHGSLIAGLCMQDYKSLCVAVTICETLANRNTQLLISLYDKKLC